eukprot:TRINITY_DN4554_c1_g1_i1.p2 TRINITY_DN4554_c1_g1~~TRINITY_DN4554_c1_g1_i1.p2  ORF type:complete len:294 (+),score=108.36 TRINITY_DN4554_c1_g1_i1:70-951(+)
MGKRLCDLPGYDAEGQAVYETEGAPEEAVPEVTDTPHQGDVVVEPSCSNAAARKVFEAEQAEQGCGVSGLRSMLSLEGAPVDFKALTTHLHSIERDATELLQETRQATLPAAALEPVDPTLLEAIASLEKDIGAAQLPRSLLPALMSMTSRVAYLEPSQLQTSVAKVQTILRLMQQTIDRKQHRGGFSEGVWREKVETFAAYENKGDEIPPLVERLLTLRPLHDEALGTAAKLREAAALNERADAELRAAQGVISSLSKQIPECAAQVASNEEALQKRMARLKKNLDKLEAAK